MKAIAFEKHGGPEVLQLRDLPVPQPRAREVRVRVKAVALNHLDVWVRVGWPGLKLALPHVLGSDIAGVVDAVGAEVTDVQPGAEVLVNPGLSCGACERCLKGDDNLCRSFVIIGEHVAGGYAEYVCVPRQNVLPKPKGLDFDHAACLPLTFLTAWTMLVRRAQLQPGETVLVQAAGSGVGSAAVQIAKLLGAKVIATASTDEKLERAKALGADHLINYTSHDFLTEVKRLTDRKMVDVVFEHVGGKTFEKSVACLPYGGRLVTCGATSGNEVKLDLKVLFYKRISLLGSTMGSKGDLFRILQLVEEGRLKPVLDRTLPLEKAAEGHALLTERKTFGNVVLNP
ncbi:MAG: zinc-binding dehydrogenase [Archangiaceae bacterium]|nr:zinc-binding dehydrogenase [Archangiaceae bacterium]